MITGHFNITNVITIQSGLAPGGPLRAATNALRSSFFISSPASSHVLNAWNIGPELVTWNVFAFELVTCGTVSGKKKAAGKASEARRGKARNLIF